MKSVRLLLKLFGIAFIASGLSSCKKDDKDNTTSRKKCEKEEFTCTYKYGSDVYTYRYCQDGWYAYYVNGKLQDDIIYDTDYTKYWTYYKQEWMDDAATYPNLTCVFD